jgi:hypothetical protein
VVSWTDTISGNELVKGGGGVVAFNETFTTNHAAVRFPGSGFLVDTTLNPTNLPSTTNVTLFIVAKPVAISGNPQRWLFRGQNSGNSRLRIVKNKYKSNWSVRVGGGAGVETTTAVTTDLSIFTLVSGKSGANDVDFLLNGTSIGRAKSTSGINLGEVKIGENFNIDVAEVLIYNRTLSDAEISEVNEYLASKYGLVKTAFDTWRKQHWGNTSDPNGDFDADPDHDGIKNGLEFIFGLDPNAAGKLGVDRFNFDGTTLTVNWMKPESSQLNYEILETDNLSPSNSWTVLSDLTRTQISVSNNFEKVEFTKPSGWALGGDERKFIRIRVTQP